MEMTREDTDLVKGMAIAMMLWHHLFLRTLEFGQFANSLAVFDKVCVSLFLFVSGYGLTKQYSKQEKHSAKSMTLFLVKRYAKFYMSYWFCFVLVLAVGYLFGYTLYEAYPNGRNVWKCLLFDVLGLMGYNSYIDTWWFNKLIIQLYLIFPLLTLLLKNKWVASFGLLAIIALEQVSCVDVFFVMEGGIVAFFVGMLMAKYDLHVSNPVASVGIGIAVIAVLTFVRFKMSEIRFTIVDGFLSLAISSVLVNCKMFYGFPVLHFFGKLATVMYLTHTLIHMLLEKVLYSLPNAVIAYALFMIFSLLVALMIVLLKELSRYDTLQEKMVGYLSKALS